MQSINMGSSSLPSNAAQPVATEQPQIQQTAQQQQPATQQQQPQNQHVPGQVNKQAQAQTPQTFANKQLAKMSKMSRQFDTMPTFDRSPVLDRKAPQFPETAFERLSNMMRSNQQTREGVSQNLSRELSNMKEKFFESYSYKTEQGQDGKPKLSYDQQGRPQLQSGKEQFQQRIARQEHETTTKQAYKEYHSNIKDSFLNNEKQQVQNFLQTHRNELGNPAIQQELQKMLAESEKKALKLQKDLDDQLKELDLPTEEMREYAKKESKKLREMEDEHKKMEDSTDEARELIMYQEEMNALAMEEKQNLKMTAQDEAYFNGLSSMLKPPSEPTLADMLPPYLVNSLYSMGIYAID